MIHSKIFQTKILSRLKYNICPNRQLLLSSKLKCNPKSSAISKYQSQRYLSVSPPPINAPVAVTAPSRPPFLVRFESTFFLF